MMTEVRGLSKIETPIVIVNFKTYIEGTGKRAIDLAKAADEVSKETGICFAVAPQFVDIPMIVKTVSYTHLTLPTTERV